MSSIIADTIKGRSKTAPDFSEGATVTGILTATNVSTVGGVNASGIVTATSGFRATAGGINVIAGVSTFANQVDANGSVDVAGIVTATSGFRATAGGLNVIAGVSTFANQIDANGCIDATGIVTASHGVRATAGGVAVTGVSTFANQVDANGCVDITGIATASHGLRATTGGLNVVAGLSTFMGGLLEKVNIVAADVSDDANVNVSNGNVHYYSANESGTATPNLRWDGSTTLGSVMTTGDTLTVSIIYKPNGAGYYEHMTIDGVAQTEEWLGGSAPSSANAGGYDIVTYQLIRTGTGTGDYIVLANVSNFA